MFLRSLPVLTLVLAPVVGSAQVTTKPDGVFRSLLGVAASVSGGNTEAASVTLTGEAVRQTEHSKWLTLGRMFYARDRDETTAANAALGTQFDQDLVNADYFLVGKLDYMRDRPANLTARYSAYGGAGRHLLRMDAHTWDVFAGVGYSEDRYVAATDVDGVMRTRYGRTEGIISESSTHQLTPTTNFKQKLEIYPDLRHGGKFRAVFDTGLSVAMTSSWQLTTGLLYRYNSHPGTDLKRYDVQFLTGITMRFD